MDFNAFSMEKIHVYFPHWALSFLGAKFKKNEDNAKIVVLWFNSCLTTSMTSLLQDVSTYVLRVSKLYRACSREYAKKIGMKIGLLLREIFPKMCHKVKFCSSIKITLGFFWLHEPGINFLQNSIFWHFSKICILYGISKKIWGRPWNVNISYIKILVWSFSIITRHNNHCKTKINSSFNYFCNPSP